MNPLIKAKFIIGEGPIFEGYHRPGDNWNGFNLPYFEKQTAEAILLLSQQEQPAFYEGCVYDPSTDQFIIHEEGQITTIEGIAIDTEHGPMKLYPVGSGYWVWELAEEN
jgi:hypothetical protein